MTQPNYLRKIEIWDIDDQSLLNGRSLWFMSCKTCKFKSCCGISKTELPICKVVSSIENSPKCTVVGKAIESARSTNFATNNTVIMFNNIFIDRKKPGSRIAFHDLTQELTRKFKTKER